MRIVTLSLLLALMPLPLGAAPGTGPAQAPRRLLLACPDSVTLTTTLLGLVDFSGRFRRMTGEILLNGPGLADDVVAVEITAQSLVMDDADWTEEMLGPDFLDVAAHPAIRFRSTRVDELGPGEGRLHGHLTMRGRTRPVIVDFAFDLSGGTDEMAAVARGFVAETRVNRSDFGMTSYASVVSDEVEISIRCGALTLD